MGSLIAAVGAAVAVFLGLAKWYQRDRTPDDAVSEEWLRTHTYTTGQTGDDL